jgi:hypothetical protein
MHTKTSLIFSSFLLLSTLCAGASYPLLASAQDPSTQGTYGVSDIQAMSPEQRRAQSADALDRMRSTLSSLQTTLESKREEKDILMLNCISARVSAVKGFLKIAEQANITLQSGSTNPDNELHQLNMIFLADGKIQILKDEADACSGGDSTQYTGPTRTLLKVDDGIRQDTDLSSPNLLTDMPLDPLPEATPYQ